MKEKYEGFDYTNVYGTDEYNKRIEKYKYVEDEKYFDDEDTITLPDGFSLHVTEYIHMEDKIVYAEMTKGELHKDGKCIYTFRSNDSSHKCYNYFISHSNGHRYYPFHIDLYGISYIDVDTLEVCHYIPRGEYNQYSEVFGESFIITDIHYDPQTNFIAYGGCIWAYPSDTMIGDFSEPLNFDPHLISIHRIIDPDYDECDDVDFVQWTDKGAELTDDRKRRITIGYDEIRKRLDEIRNISTNRNTSIQRRTK